MGWGASGEGARGNGEGGSQAERSISTAWLHRLPGLDLRPIHVVFFDGPLGSPGLELGFPLRCVQWLSDPNVATRRCRWRDNRYTRGSSIPVLSY